MNRNRINETELEKIAGGSIVFNEDNTTCGRNRNDQYRVVDFDKVLAYLLANNDNMSEKQMINNLVAQGLLVEL